jgi:hypothetical protein
LIIDGIILVVQEIDGNWDKGLFPRQEFNQFNAIFIPFYDLQKVFMQSDTGSGFGYGFHKLDDKPVERLWALRRKRPLSNAV